MLKLANETLVVQLMVEQKLQNHHKKNVEFKKLHI